MTFSIPDSIKTSANESEFIEPAVSDIKKCSGVLIELINIEFKPVFLKMMDSIGVISPALQPPILTELVFIV
jgi:hypothetical protein